MTAADLAALDDDGGLPAPSEVDQPVDAADALARVVDRTRADLARLVDRHDAALELSSMVDDLSRALGRDLYDVDDLLAAAALDGPITEAKVTSLLNRIAPTTNGVQQ